MNVFRRKTESIIWYEFTRPHVLTGDEPPPLPPELAPPLAPAAEPAELALEAALPAMLVATIAPVVAFTVVPMTRAAVFCLQERSG